MNNFLRKSNDKPVLISTAAIFILLSFWGAGRFCCAILVKFGYVVIWKVYSSRRGEEQLSQYVVREREEARVRENEALRNNNENDMVRNNLYLNGLLAYKKITAFEMWREILMFLWSVGDSGAVVAEVIVGDIYSRDMVLRRRVYWIHERLVEETKIVLRWGERLGA